MSLFFIGLLMMLVLSVLAVTLAIRVDKTTPHPTPLSGQYDLSDQPGVGLRDSDGRDDTFSGDDLFPDHEMSLIQHGDLLYEQVRQYNEELQKSNYDPSSALYKQFVSMLHQLYQEYEARIPGQSDEPVVNAASDEPMLSDEPNVSVPDNDDLDAIDRETDSVIDSTGQAQSNVKQMPVDPELKQSLDQLLERGRKLLERYSNFIHKQKNLSAETAKINRRVRELEESRSRLDVDNASLREQLSQSQRRVSELQSSYDEAADKLDALNSSYQQKVAELKAEEDKLRAMESECVARQAELEAARSEKQQQSEQIGQLTDHLARKNKEHSDLNVELNTRSSSMQQNLQQQEESCKRLRAELERAVAENRADAEQLREQMNQAQSKLAESEKLHRDEVAKCEQQLSELKRDLDFTAAQLKESKQREAEHERREREMEAQVASLKDLLGAATKQFNAQVDNVEDAGKLVEELKNQCSAFQRSMDDERNRLSDAERKVREYEERLRNTEAELNEAKKRRDEQTRLLQQEQGDFEAYKARFNQDEMDRVEQECYARLQRESKAKLECLQSLDDKERDLARLKNRLESRIHDLEYALKRQKSGSSE